MTTWECQVCGHRYVVEEGDESRGIPPGTLFEGLPADWRCPECGAGKKDFDEAVDFLEVDENKDDVEEDDSGEDEEGLDDDDDLSDEDESEDEDHLRIVDVVYDIGVDDFDEDDFDDFIDEELDGYLYNDFDEEDPDDDYEDDDSEEDVDPDSDDDRLDQEDKDDFEEGDDEISDDESDLDEADLEVYDIEKAFEDVEEMEEDTEGLEEDHFEVSTRFICPTCQWVYDPARGDANSGVAAGTSFEKLFDDWSCPSCGAGKETFKPHEDAFAPLPFPAGPAEKAAWEQLLSFGYQQNPDILTPSPSAARLERFGLGDLFFAPAPLLMAPSGTSINTRTQIGGHAESPLHLSTPVLISPVSFGPLTEALKVVIAKATARVGTACISGGPPSLEARRAAGSYITEIMPAFPALPPEELAELDAIEICLGTVPWESDLPQGQPDEARTPIEDVKQLVRLVQEIRRTMKGPVGIRLPAGDIDRDLERVLAVKPDYIVVEGYGAALGQMPSHIKDHAYLPIWLAVHRARTYLRTHKLEGVELVAAGEVRSSADVAKLLALGANAVVISLPAVVAMGLSPLRFGAKGTEELLNMQFEPQDAVERLVDFIKTTNGELIDYCRLVRKNDVHGFDRSDLLTLSGEMARLLDLKLKL